MSSDPAVIARVFGGLGNQLFIYASMRALSLRNNVSLKLDAVSGFQKDRFQRSYHLDKFCIQAEIATAKECYLGLSGRLRRICDRFRNRGRALEKRAFVEESDLSEKLAVQGLQVKRRTYFEGYWQSEQYFADFEKQIRKELSLAVQMDEENCAWATKIEKENSVGVHVRQLDIRNRLSPEYYRRAAVWLKDRLGSPQFYVFADDNDWAREHLSFLNPSVFLHHNGAETKCHADLWLMRRCQHHIIANSTFSWWGAWLGYTETQAVVAPKPVNNWGGTAFFPTHWHLL